MCKWNPCNTGQNVCSPSCGLYYKHVTIINDDSRVINKLEASLTDDARVIIYDRHMFIILATGFICLKICCCALISSFSCVGPTQTQTGKKISISLQGVEAPQHFLIRPQLFSGSEIFTLLFVVSMKTS